MENDREAGKSLFDFSKDVETERRRNEDTLFVSGALLSSKLVSTVRSTDRDCERVNTGLGNEFFNFFGLGVYNNTVYVSKQDVVNKTLPVIIASSKSGMVGIPEPTATGVDIRMLLDVSIVSGQTLELRSELLPRYNGLYNVHNVTHRGSVRDNDFYTDLQCIRVSGV